MLDMTSFLICPKCRGALVREHASFDCPNCAKSYPMLDGIPQFDQPDTSAGETAATGENGVGGSRDHRRNYWDSGWEARFKRDHAFLNELKTRSDWQAYLEQQRVALGEHAHVSVVEANGDSIRDRVLLDIGCGAGTSGAMFGYLGARYIGVDHSRHAAMYTLRHLRAVGGDGFTIQGNAEALPIRDESIDVVYSNGVLHHTPNFLTAMHEAYRVLKPGGKAIIALYATYSTQFGIVRVLGALKGNLSRRNMDRWMGAASEGAWRTGSRLNPWTQTFSKSQVSEVVAQYHISGLEIRKNGHPIGEFPWLGRRLMRFETVRKVDRALEPAFGSMLVMSFNKSAELH
jgi:SAM-dependent methyltransferase